MLHGFLLMREGVTLLSALRASPSLIVDGASTSLAYP